MASNESLAARQQLNDDFKVLLQDTQNLLNATKGDLSGKADEARTKLEQRMEELKGKYRELEGKAVNSVRGTEELVREYPLHSLGVTFGAGLLLGLFMGRK